MEYPLSCLPPATQQELLSRLIEKAVPGAALPPVPDAIDAEIEMDVYADAPEWARKQADRYLNLFSLFQTMKGKTLKSAIDRYSAAHPDSKTSYPSFKRNLKIYREQGIGGLLAHWGVRADRRGSTPTIQAEWFDFFKSVYLVEGGVSYRTAHRMTLGFAVKENPSISASSFPDVSSFIRRLNADIGPAAIYFARNGEAAWNRKHAGYIVRNGDDLKPGEYWVSDHHQLDVAVRLPNGRYCFPWVTAWRDFKTGKWLGWLLHAEAPNSDHIFAAFYSAARKFGIPKAVLLDNGKDYRCRDFAGGRPVKKDRIKAEIDMPKTRSMLSQLNIEPHFAIVYRAQTKPIERDFRTHKEMFSKLFPGYRGGNVTERPEKLKGEISKDRIPPLASLMQDFDRFVLEVFNRIECLGKNLKGKNRDQAWEEGSPVLSMVRPDALRLFCTRISRPLTIGRNGIYDSEIGKTYWGEWMAAIKGTKVYMRRNADFFNEAWIHRSEDDSFLGMAEIAEQVAAIATTPQQRAVLKAEMAKQRREKKILQSLLPAPGSAPSGSLALDYLAAGVKAENDARGWQPKEGEAVVMEPARTPMDDVIAQRKEMEQRGMHDLGAIVPVRPQKKPLFATLVDKEMYEREQARQESERLAAGGQR